jgi:hypothetical protein
MSEFSNIPLVAHQLCLILHTAVDFGHKEGIGIGIIQRAATGAPRASSLPMEEHKHGIERGQFRAKNVRTRERAHMFALILAMGLAHSTLKRRCTTTRIKVQSVTVLCSLPAVVELIKYHRGHGPKSLESVVSTEDRSMIKRSTGECKTTVAIQCPNLSRRRWGRRQYCGGSKSKDDSPPEKEEGVSSPSSSTTNYVHERRDGRH